MTLLAKVRETLALHATSWFGSAKGLSAVDKVEINRNANLDGVQKDY